MQLERQMAILKALQTNGTVSVTDLSRTHAVALNTIRRDLRSLEQQGLLAVTRGGAVGAAEAQMGLTLGQREDQLAEEKQRIGRKACEFIGSGQAIILDAGTTTERIVPGLREFRNLTVITNGLNIARCLSGIPGITIVLCGGILNEVTGSLAGFHAEEFIRQFHVDTAFISAGGVSVDGISNTNAFEVRMKRSMIAAADKVVLVATREKIGRVSLAPFAGLEEIDLVITDTGASGEELVRLRECGLEVLTC
jgi:DeoR/GlpR family transcriptional regulator of sugar metabolism